MQKIFFQKKEETILFDPVELRDKLYKISNKEESGKQIKNTEDSADPQPIQEKLEEIKNQIEQNKTDIDEQFEKTQNGIQKVKLNKICWQNMNILTIFLFWQVQDQVGEVYGVINRIVTQFIFSIQGFFFCFIFGIILIGIGLKRNPQVLDYW